MSDLDDFKRDLKKDLAAGRKAFEEKYAEEINALLGLSREEIDAITPDGADLQEYDRLIAVVKRASQHNISQASLKKNIKDLGEIAVKIAKKIPSLAAMLAA